MLSDISLLLVPQLTITLLEDILIVSTAIMNQVAIDTRAGFGMDMSFQLWVNKERDCQTIW